MAQKNKWKVISKKGKNFEIFFISLLSLGFTDTSQKNTPLQMNVSSWLQVKGDRYLPSEEFGRYKNQFLDLFKHDINTVISELRLFEKILISINKNSYNIIKTDFDDLDLPIYIKSWANNFYLPMQYDYDYYFLNQPAADVILEALKRNDSQDVFADFEILSQAKELSQIQKEKIDLLTIVAKLQANKVDLDTEIDKHLDKYAGLGMYFFRGKPWTKEDIAKRIDNWSDQDINSEIAKLETFTKADELTKQILAKYDFTEYEKKVVTLMKQISYVSNKFDETYTNFIFQSRPLLNFVADKIGVPYRNMIELSFFEVLNLLQDNKKADKKLIDSAIAREKDSLLLAAKGKVDIYIPPQSDKIALQELGEDEVSDREQLKGVCACQGKAKGKVVIFKAVEDLAKVEEGDIMVAVATVPAFVPAMEKAAGIITEMGGMLSHAAIVSREMNTPCVVGVNNVTKILKDGDIVAIDAKEGIVKKI